MLLDFRTLKVLPTFICIECGTRRFEHAFGTKCLFSPTVFNTTYMVDEGGQFNSDLRSLTPEEANAYEVYCELDLDRGK